MTVTYHDHPLATLPPDGTEDVPAWQSGVAVRIPFAYVRRPRFNATPLSAAGSDQSGATALPAGYQLHIVNTVAANTGLRIPVMAAGTEGEELFIFVRLAALADPRIYPASGGQINDQALNSPIIVPRGTTGHFLCISTLNWVTCA